MSRNALIVFARAPVEGQVKTRLAKEIGERNALEVYRGLLNFTRSVSDRLQEDRFVFFDQMPSVDDEWSDELYKKCTQSGSDLGERMNNASAEILNKKYEKVVIIGTDCIDMRLDILQMAFRKLDACDVVVGPARDGGFYLIGMKEQNPFLFEGRSWSNPLVLDETRRLLEENSRTYALLPELNDLDTKQDLIDFMKKLNTFRYQ